MEGLFATSQNKRSLIIVLLGLVVAVFLGVFTSDIGIVLPLLFIALPVLGILLLLFSNYPKAALYTLITYCFIYPIFAREIGGMPYGTLVDVILILSWIAVIKIPKDNWKYVEKDLINLLLLWFFLCVAEVANPARPSVMGWLQEIRSVAFYPLLIVPLAFLLFNKVKDLNLFLILIIGISTLAALNGIKQLHIGLSPGELRFLKDGGAVTHLLWGRLRVFSFYSEAAQFGASQAAIGLITLVLALGPFKRWKRMALFIASALMFYGMLMSGTRGALFGVVVGAFIALLLSKKFKAVFIGGVLMLLFLVFLKYTYIGNGNYQIYRLRSAVDPTDPSLNVRFNTQRIMREYMKSRPFGDGLGVMGNWGMKYNGDKFISRLQPDSYFVKLWGMCGIIGLTIWLCIMMYILGKCCGIIWKIRDPGLRIKMIALTAGYAGILACSYGNEVINTMPSSFVVYVSWAFVFLSPKLEEEIEKNNLLKAA